MAKNLQIGSDIVQFPENQENPGWGENVLKFAELVTNALKTVQGPNDITTTSATLANNVSSFTNIPNLTFNAAQVQSIETSYLIVRVYDSGTTTVTESGTIKGNYDGSDFYISTDNVGDAGIEFAVTAAGQLQYTSTNLANHVSSTIRFNAKTIDQP